MDKSVFGLPKVLLMGLRKSGKSSIQKILFEGMQPHESVNLPTTITPAKTTVRSNEFINFEVWDFPGQNNPFDQTTRNRNDVSNLLDNYGAIVFVLDCSDLIDDARARLLDTICTVYEYNKNFYIEIFIHKVDKLNDTQKGDLYATLKRRVEEEAKQRLDDTTELLVNFNLTSIYDHSVFEAFSIVVQRLISKKTHYITLSLEQLNTNSNFMLSYLFLSKSKIYLGMDEHVHYATRYYDLCSDAIEMVARMGGVYMAASENMNTIGKQTTTESTYYNNKKNNNDDDNSNNINNNPNNTYEKKTHKLIESGEMNANNNDINNNNVANSSNNNNIKHNNQNINTVEISQQKRDFYKREDEPTFTTIMHNNEKLQTNVADTLDQNSSSLIYLNKTNCIYIKELPNSLTFVAMMECANLENKLLIDRNIDIFYDTVYDIFTTKLN